jgi:chitodextrinase
VKWIQPRTEVIKNSLAVFVVLLVSVIGIKLLFASHAATGATLSLSSSSTAVTPGGNFSVTIAEDSGTNPVNAVQASLNYDATQLQYVSTTEGTAFPSISATSTATPGVYRVARSTVTPVTGANNLVTVNFKVLASSGSLDLSFDDNFSLVVQSADSSNILGTTNGLTVPVSGTATASASMSLSPATGTAATGSTITVTVRENSGTTPVNAVQSAIQYDPTQLQFMNLSEGGTFTSISATDTATAGLVRVARSVAAGADGISGDNPVVTLSFKVLAASGTAALTIDKTESIVASASDSSNILNTVAGDTYTIGSTPVSSGPTLLLSPTSGSYAAGSTIAVAVSSNSTAALTTAEAVLDYPADKLQYVSTTEGGVFTSVQRTNTSTPGVVDIIRGLPGGTPGVTGTNAIVTVNFKVLASGTAAVTFGSGSALFDDSGTGTNILDLASSTPASYTLTGGGVNPTPPANSNTLSLSPASGTYAPNSTVSVVVNTNSVAALTTAEAVIDYPVSQLQYVSTTEGGVFTSVQRTNTSTPGVVDIIRGLPGGTPGVTGTNALVTLNFKVVGTSGTAALTYGTGSALFDASGSGTNIIDQTDSTGASYTVSNASGCSSAPTTPGMPTQTSNNYSTITLSWTASTAGSGCTLSGYHVYRNGVSVGDVTSGTSFTDSGLAVGTTYSYTVAAFDAAGHTSIASSAASLTTKADDMAPTTPASVTGTSPNSVSVNLAWNPSTDFPNPGGVGVAGYHIYRDGATSPTYTVTSGTTFTDMNVSPSTTYTYTITAYDKLGNESAPSNIVTVITAAPNSSCTDAPSIPTGLAGGASTLTTTTLSWNASTAASNCVIAGYHIYRNSVLVGSSATTSFQDTGLTAHTSYNYTVAAYDDGGHISGLSTAVTIVTGSDTTAPAAPTNVTATAISAGHVNIAWTASTDNVRVASYRVYRNGVLISSGNDLKFADTMVVGNTDYVYSVSAVDGSGNESTKTTALPNPLHTPTSTDAQAPKTPSGLHLLAVTTRSAVIGWTASTDNVAVAGYHVYRDGTYIGDASSTSFSATNLTDNSTYIFTVKAFDASGNISGASNALSVATLQPASCIAGDLNCDGKVDIYDLSIMLSHWGEVNVPVKFGDINQDGIVDQSDLTTLLSDFGDNS